MALHALDLFDGSHASLGNSLIALDLFDGSHISLDNSFVGHVSLSDALPNASTRATDLDHCSNRGPMHTDFDLYS